MTSPPSNPSDFHPVHRPFSSTGWHPDAATSKAARRIWARGSGLVEFVLGGPDVSLSRRYGMLSHSIQLMPDAKACAPVATFSRSRRRRWSMTLKARNRASISVG